MKDWISVKTRFPEISGNVLVWCKGEKFDFPWIYHFSTVDDNFVDNKLEIATDKVMYWMPLPEPLRSRLKQIIFYESHPIQRRR